MIGTALVMSRRTLLLAFLIAARSVAASGDPALPLYQPRPVALPATVSYLDPDGAVVVVGYNDMRDILTPLAARFTATHPSIRIALELPGTRFAPAALASGKSALAPMGAELTPPQLADYRAKVGADPIALRVAHASLDARALSGPLGIFVHRDNPIAALTMAEVGRVFAGEVTRWGQLGATGEWVGRPIHACGLEHTTALAYFIQQAALDGRALSTTMAAFPQSADVVRRVGEDALSIGFAAAMRTNPEVRLVPIAARPGAEAVGPTPESIVDDRYPLDRFLLVYVRPPISPFAREFLRLMLSREGQAAVAASPQGYLPLSAKDAAAERVKLEALP
jgi:phosphate transport system substrate-binding protein